ncbi:YezD family protein [Shouchella plakortidis]|uniref:YezD family protein n=1 Tax=Alkalicoccobacillus plakortidis TaxID=444060 RepID=A0ABT0XH46_9BACI|nr:DUF2292 domain-containing protein [Alkalicoccobacillus plakortidis]MCM2674532.1 YezD family protein [Alkalicoccobacillus plakortidis]
MAQTDPIKIDEIEKKINSIKYGTVLITIHNDQITQIDATEKTRFTR